MNHDLKQINKKRKTFIKSAVDKIMKQFRTQNAFFLIAIEFLNIDIF